MAGLFIVLLIQMGRDGLGVQGRHGAAFTLTFRLGAPQGIKDVGHG